jgi:hypothetical protein
MRLSHAEKPFLEQDEMRLWGVNNTKLYSFLSIPFSLTSLLMTLATAAPLLLIVK